MNETTDLPESELSLIDLLALALKGWKLLVLTTFIGGTVGILLSKWKLPVYQADALIQIDTDDQGRVGGNLGELADVFGSVSKAETETEIVRSRMVLLPVVDSLNLIYSASPVDWLNRLRGRQGRILLKKLDLPELTTTSKSNWTLINRGKSGMVLHSPSGDSICNVFVGQPVMRLYGDDTIQIEIAEAESIKDEVFVLNIANKPDVANRLYNSLSVGEKGKKTGIIELSYEDQYPDRAAMILNEITRSYMRQNIDAKSAEAQKTLLFLKQQLPFVKARLDSADYALNEYRLSRGTIDLTTEAKLALDQQVQLGQQLLQLQQNKQELTRLYEENHPQVVAMNRQIERLQSMMGRSSGKVKALPQTQQEVLKLTRDVTVATEFYQTMQDKIQQLEVVRAGEVGSARIIDTAQISDVPIKPNRRLMQIVGVFFGFAFGFGVLLIIRTLDKGVRDASHIEKISSVSVFAQIPHSVDEVKNSSKRGIKTALATVASDDLAVESLRSLRTALEFSLIGQGGKVLGITGLTPGVGKSFVSINLGVLFARTGRRVLLVDADLRKGRLHWYFGGKRESGLSELLSSKISLSNAIRQSQVVPSLSFLSTGAYPPNPSEMLGSTQLGDLMKDLRSMYDLVIVDTSPILLVTDAALVLRHADHSTIIMEQGKHSATEIREGVRAVKVRENLGVSIALNKCTDGFSGYGKYKKFGKYTALDIDKS